MTSQAAKDAVTDLVDQAAQILADSGSPEDAWKLRGFCDRLIGNPPDGEGNGGLYADDYNEGFMPRVPLPRKRVVT